MLGLYFGLGFRAVSVANRLIFRLSSFSQASKSLMLSFA